MDANQQTNTSAVVLDEQYLSDKPPCNLDAKATFKRCITQINNITSLPAGDLSPVVLQQYTAAAALSNQTSGQFDYLKRVLNLFVLNYWMRVQIIYSD